MSRRSDRPGHSLLGRACTRAGAVAEVLAAGPNHRLMALPTRVMLLVAGSAALAVSVAATLWTGLGPGPLDVFIGAVRVRTGLPLSVSVWLVIGSLIVAAWALGRRPGVGTLVGPFLVGAMLEVALSVLHVFDPPASFVVKVAIQFAAIAGIGLGAGALIVSGLGAGSGELLAMAASDRSGRSEPRVRLAFEASWLVLGVALGGPAGFGTVLVALTIGSAVARGYRVVDGGFARLQRATDPTRLPRSGVEPQLAATSGR